MLSVLKRNKIVSIFVGIFTLCMIFTAISVSVKAAGNIYYVDSISGNDANNGTSSSAPWKTLTKVNSAVFQPGDQILFKKGASWMGTLEVTSSGNSNAQITYGSYGTGNKPIINGSGAYQAIRIMDKSYITIRDLEITNPAADSGDRKGIFIFANGNTMSGIQILNNDIHDVKGKYGESDYFWAAAILCDAYAYNIDNLMIEGNSIYNNECQGIYTNGTGGTDGIRYNNLIIRNNTLNYNVKGDIIVGKALNPLIEYNVGMNAGQGYDGIYYIASMWEWGCNGSTFQYNEVANVNAADHLSWGGDSQAFDVDISSKGTHVFQYNYTHNNEGGTLLVMAENPELNSTIYRYNISQNDGHYNCNPWDNNQTWDGTRGSTVSVNNPGSDGTHIYNNVWYNDTSDGIRLMDAAVNYKNNIFYTTGEYKYPISAPKYDSNCYYGGVAPSTDLIKIVSNPNFVNPGSGGNGRSSVDGYKLQSDSPCINSGVSISNNGGKDYWGSSLYNGIPDIGAHEYSVSVVTPTPIPDTEVRSGSYSEKVAFTTQDEYKYIMQYTPVLANTNYMGEIWVKGSGSLEYIVQDTSTWTTLSAATISATDLWTKYTMPTFSSGNRNTVAVLCKILPGTSGTLYMDDLFFGIPGGANILSDPGFESGITWQGLDTTPFTRIYSDATPTPEPVENVRSGSYSEKVAFTSVDEYKYIMQYAPVQSYTNYSGEIWVKGSGSIEYIVQDTSTWTTLSAATISATGVWTKYTIPTFGSGNRSTVAVLCKILPGTSGTLYMDDVFFGMSGGTNVLLDPGFEEGTSWYGLNIAPFSRITR
ncbi:MAG: hypothetical protein ACK5JH_05890 [Anaerocolumna sp.]